MKKHKTMKVINDSHDVIIETIFVPVDKGTKAGRGDVIPHRKEIIRIYKYYEISDGRYIKVELPAKMILEIATQIKDIEKQIADMPYDDLPF